MLVNYAIGRFRVRSPVGVGFLSVNVYMRFRVVVYMYELFLYVCMFICVLLL